MESLAKQLADAQRCGVYQSARKPEEVQRAAEQAGLAVFRIELKAVRDKKAFLGHVASALHFPEWFGGNWDALHDCLTDLEWVPATNGYVLIFEQAEHFGSNQRQEFDEATAVLISAAEYWKSKGRPFWALVAAPGMGLRSAQVAIYRPFLA